MAIDHTAWGRADEMVEIDRHPRLGQVRVRQWKNLHFYRAAGHPLNLILVERIKPMSNGRPFPPLWLAWVGARNLSLEKVWFKYLRRFGVDHWYRFVKQRLQVFEIRDVAIEFYFTSRRVTEEG